MDLRVAVISNSQFFGEYQAALVREIRKKGFEAEGFDYINYDYKPDVFILIGIHKFNKFKKYGKYIYCGIQTEQLPSKASGGRIFGSERLRQFYKHYKYYDIIFEWSHEIFQQLSKKRRNISYFPHSRFDEIDYLKGEECKAWEELDYDLVFIGDPYGVKNRRADILSKLNKQFKVYPKSNGIWGDEKKKAILNSRICLNLHFEFSAYCEYPRLFEYLSNKKFVLSEKIFNPSPFVDGEDFISFYENELINKVDYYLQNSHEAEGIALNGYNKTLEFQLEKTIDHILIPVLLEKYYKEKVDYRILNSVFHITGIDSLKDISGPVYLFNTFLKRSVFKLFGR